MIWICVSWFVFSFDKQNNNRLVLGCLTQSFCHLTDLFMLSFAITGEAKNVSVCVFNVLWTYNVGYYNNHAVVDGIF